MQTPASIRKHPIHPMLIVFPIGLWVFSFVCDLIFMYTSQPAWSVVAFWTMVGGVVGALMAAVPGFIDYLSIRDRRIGRIATIHMVLNLTAVLLFVLNLGIRWNRPLTPSSAILLSLVGLGILGVSGWLGGSLVYKHAVGVAHVPLQVEDARSYDRDRRVA
jgi:uncharacterized membrane protein